MSTAVLMKKIKQSYFLGVSYWAGGILIHFLQ